MGGIITALSVAAMFLTAIIPFFTYILPICAGVLLIVVVNELSRYWAFGVYCAVSVLGILVVADKEAALMYIAFFGYYPIIREPLNRLPVLLRIPVKYVIFNATVVCAYAVIIKVFGFSADEFSEFGKYTIPILLVLANVLFTLYDLILSVLNIRYKKDIRKRLRKLFGI